MLSYQIIYDLISICGCLVFAFAVRKYFYKFANEQISEIIQAIPNHEIPIRQLEGTDEEKTRLEQQMVEIKSRAQNHLKLMKEFYLYYFTFVAPASVLGIFAAITLVFISKSGWDKANRHLLIVFVVLTGVAALLRTFPIIFKYEKNIVDNKTQYLRYIALEHELLSYFATSESIDGESKTLSQVIHYLDNQFNEIHNFYIGFDIKHLPDYLAQLKDKSSP